MLVDALQFISHAEQVGIVRRRRCPSGAAIAAARFQKDPPAVQPKVAVLESGNRGIHNAWEHARDGMVKDPYSTRTVTRYR